jgi:hypothetical protein
LRAAHSPRAVGVAGRNGDGGIGARVAVFIGDERVGLAGLDGDGEETALGILYRALDEVELAVFLVAELERLAAAGGDGNLDDLEFVGDADGFANDEAKGVERNFEHTESGSG